MVPLRYLPRPTPFKTKPPRHFAVINTGTAMEKTHESIATATPITTPASTMEIKSPESRVVKILSSGYVTPESDSPTHKIWLSNLDLAANRKCYTPTIYLYKPTPEDDLATYFDAAQLKASLARALVPFYPYAGELGYDDTGRAEVHCTGKGVLFVEAVCEWTMEEFGEFTPSPTVGKLFLPAAVTSAEPPCPILLVQLTKFKCGGVCLGTAVHHMMGDGGSSLRFINAWADIARGTDPSSIKPPVLDRSLLKPRSPPSIQFDHTEYAWCTAGADDNAPPPPMPKPAATASVPLTKDQVARLKGDKPGLTTFSAVVAHAWKTACKARGLAADQPTRVYMGGDIRSRLRPPLPAEYLGNATLLMKAEGTVAEVIAGSIEDVGGRIEHAKTKLYDEYLRSLIDYLELAEGTRKGRAFLPPTDHIAVNWLNLPIYLADFGWGKPIYMHRAVLPVRGGIYATRNPARNDGGVIVTVALEEEFMPEFKKIFYDDLKEI